jgi:hypothetical protein
MTSAGCRLGAVRENIDAFGQGGAVDLITFTAAALAPGAGLVLSELASGGPG